MNEIIQLKISLQGTKPLIWRRVLVENSISFFKLHYIIQCAMGWENSHLFEFNVGGLRIGEPHEDDEGWGGQLMDSVTIILSSLIKIPKEQFTYTYDFGDDWVHLIKLEKFLPIDKNLNYSICIDGELNCPPEDCGGIWGFYDMLEKLKNKKHPEYKELIDWLGKNYDPNKFDIDEVNKSLLLLNR